MKMLNFKVHTLEGPESQHDYIIEVTDGQYAGTQLHFGKIQMTGEDEEGNGQLSFEYDIVTFPEGITLQENRDELDVLAGDVLRQIIMDIYTREPNGKEDRNTNPEQSTE
jgi:hypothetical protein